MLADTLMQPDGIDPELLKQIMGLGSVDQRYKLLQQQAARGDQLAGGTPIDYGHGKGTPLLLASLANLISSGVGGYQEGKAVAGQRSLVDQTTGARSAFAKALMGASQPTPDAAAPGAPAGFVGPPAPGNDYASVDAKRQGLLGTLQSAGLMSGDPVIAGAMTRGPQIALEQQKLAEGRLTLANEQREADAATNPQKAVALRELAAKYGVNVPEGTPGGTIQAILGPVAKKYEEDTKRLQVPKFVPAGQFPGTIDQRTGKFTPYTNADGSPVTDVHEQRERAKRKAALNVGPDLEPSADLMGKVENGLADPKSPGMDGPLKELAKLNSAAAGFSDVAQQLRDFYAKHPNGALTGTDATRAEAIAQDLRSLYMQNLNMQTLRASDIPILDKVISDPSSLSSMIKSATGIKDLSAQLDTAVNLAKQRTLSQAGALGYQPTKTGRYAGFQQRTDQTQQTPPPDDRDAQAVQIARDRLKKNPNDATALQVLKLNGVQP